MRVVICGGAGFVGLNIAECLIAEGREVVLADLAPPPETLQARLPKSGWSFQRMDVTDPASVAATIAHPIDQVVFGAAITAGVERDREMPERVMQTNLVGFLNVLRAARDTGVGRVVNLSSTAAYGTAAFEDDPLDEGSTRPSPDSLYSISKFGTERMARRMADVWSMDIRSVRLSGVFGRYEYQTSFRDTPSPLFQVAMAARNGRQAILARPGVRDWVYGSDVGGAISALLKHPDPGFDLYNIATGAPFAVLDWGCELARRAPGFACRLAEASEEPTIDLFATKDRNHLAVDRLLNDLAYRPKFDLSASVEDYWAWLGA